MSELHDELLKILEDERLTPYFQPIVSLLHPKILGYEALIRGPSGSPLYTPYVLFTTADQYCLGDKLEFLSREISLKHYGHLKRPEKLFINVSPSIFLHPDFKHTLSEHFEERFGLPPQSVVIEITERQATDNYLLMREVVKHCRELGFQIALDDLGEGYSGLRLWAEIRPDYVKLDKHFIENLHQDPVKMAFVRSIKSIAESMNCLAIAEGVETEAEYHAAKRLGIDYAQGFYFAHPSPEPLGKINTALMSAQPLSGSLSYLGDTFTAAHIAQPQTALPESTLVEAVLDWFQKHPLLPQLPLVDDGKVQGLIFRDRFFGKLFSSRFGLELYGKKPISLFAEAQPFMIEAATPLAELSQQLTATSLEDPAFIVIEQGRYFGIATVRNLLEQITQQQILNAKQANPLTGLPGSVPTNYFIDQLLARQQDFAVGYFDLDHFKPFNDVYGYASGDNIIKTVAAILQHHIPAATGLIGHIGGDDFIVVFTTDAWQPLCKNILADFGRKMPGHYSDEHLKNGGMDAHDRNGKPCFIPLVSLSVGIVSPKACRNCLSHVELADLAAYAKSAAKKISGNSFFIYGQ